jgi:hypothetical protein
MRDRRAPIRYPPATFGSRLLGFLLARADFLVAEEVVVRATQQETPGSGGSAGEIPQPRVLSTRDAGISVDNRLDVQLH